jgi:hypothetical protein
MLGWFFFRTIEYRSTIFEVRLELRIPACRQAGIDQCSSIHYGLIDQFIKQTFMQLNRIILAHFVAAVTADAFFLVDDCDFIDNYCIAGASFFAGTTGGTD